MFFGNYFGAYFGDHFGALGETVARPRRRRLNFGGRHIHSGRRRMFTTSGRRW